MMTAKVSTEVRKIGSSTSVIEIVGELNGAAENTLMDAYSQASVDDVMAIILNFEQLTYMNSSGIGLLVTLLIRANREGKRLIATGLNEHYRNIFELTRLNEAIATYPSLPEALQATTLA